MNSWKIFCCLGDVEIRLTVGDFGGVMLIAVVLFLFPEDFDVGR
jgi:hypothetical protein